MATKASDKYYTILTQIGQAKIANALAYGRKISFTHFALGDGGGASYDPDENQTALKNEVYRAAVANVLMSDESIGMLEINMAVPADTGGFTVREMGVFDEAGDLIAIAKTPDDPKPTAASGAAKDVVYRLFIILSNTDAIEIKIDPTVTVATKKEIQQALQQAKTYTDNALEQANAYTDEALANASTQYGSFTEIDNTFTEATPLTTVLTAMPADSSLITPVSANDTDYPAGGLLEVVKYDGTHIACTLSALDGIYTLTITPENSEQIFGGGEIPLA